MKTAINPFNTYWHQAFDRLRLRLLDKRNITVADVQRVVENASIDSVQTIGQSYQGRDIIKLSMGTGPKPVLAWAAMHGNESTSMRGWLDLFCNQHDSGVQRAFEALLSDYTIHFIPLLNPDGAAFYSRRNMMGIDMNRDARALQSPEMQCLLEQVNELKPVLAFNLHDQRNIFTDGKLPATISFLAPSVDLQRAITPERQQTMDLIGVAAEAIKPVMTGGIGRYTDEYYPTAVGECIQQMGIPTILVECGPAKNDSLRQVARMLNPIILHSVLTRFSEHAEPEITTYQNIPINKSNQADVILRSVKVGEGDLAFQADIALLVELKLIDGKLHQGYRVLDVGDLSHLIGLEDYKCTNSVSLNILHPGELANFELETEDGKLIFREGVRAQ